MTNQKSGKYDVGVVGVGVGANYGSVLTYYSLYKAIEAFGKSVLLVSKIGAKANDPEIQNTHAIRFAKEHYNLSKVYSQTTVHELNDLVDTFVIGSDQVWNYGVSQHFGKSFYLDFARDDKRKISYATSFGHEKDFSPPEEIPNISALMRRFNAISVREDSGVTIAQNVYGIPATHVIDPIFLTTADDYIKLSQRSTKDVSEPYLLAYILDPTPEKRDAILHMANKMGLKVRVILDGWPHLFAENSEKMGIPGAVEADVEAYDFLKLYANCAYVVTDSFHGTAFALKFSKPFASIGNKRRGMTRFKSILKLVGLQDRFTLNPKDIIERDEHFMSPVDYVRVNKVLEQDTKRSREWLGAALKRPVKNTVSEAPATHVGARTISNASKHLSRALGITSQVAALVGDRLGKRSFKISAPQFTTNNAAWVVKPGPQATELALSSPEACARGNLVWCDFPAPLRNGGAYEMTIEWVVRSPASTVNIHLRNPKTGKFKVVGAVAVGNQRGVPRTDKISFVTPDDGFSQFMLGALHFPGPAGGAEIRSIAVRPILPQAVVPNAASAAGKSIRRDPLATVKDLSQTDSDRFIKAYAHHRISRSLGNARSLLMFYSHGFEKGLSRTDNFRPGFGDASMAPLAKEMNKWLSAGNSDTDSFFLIAASVMHIYFARHQDLGVDVSHFWKLFDPKVQAAIERAGEDLGGAIAANEVREPVVQGPSNRSFSDVVFSRRSVREFTSAPVDDASIRQAVEIALQAPSVCNRQPVRVHQFDNVDMMRAALELQGGFRGYKMPPKLLLVTSDLSAFVGAVERNQAFIDGGLFMMLLLLGLEQMGLGACSLNTAMSREKEQSVRRLLGIPDSQVFISFIAVGHFDSDVMVPRSKRIPVDEIVIGHPNRLATVD